MELILHEICARSPAVPVSMPVVEGCFSPKLMIVAAAGERYGRSRPAAEGMDVSVVK